MGNYNKNIDSTWYENDGVVNSASMSHPFGSEIIDYSGILKTGVWQSMEKLNMDHQSVIGHGNSLNENKILLVLYKEHCALLCSLE